MPSALGLMHSVEPTACSSPALLPTPSLSSLPVWGHIDPSCTLGFEPTNPSSCKQQCTTRHALHRMTSVCSTEASVPWRKQPLQLSTSPSSTPPPHTHHPFCRSGAPRLLRDHHRGLCVLPRAMQALPPPQAAPAAARAAPEAAGRARPGAAPVIHRPIAQNQRQQPGAGLGGPPACWSGRHVLPPALTCKSQPCASPPSPCPPDPPFPSPQRHPPAAHQLAGLPPSPGAWQASVCSRGGVGGAARPCACSSSSSSRAAGAAGGWAGPQWGSGLCGAHVGPCRGPPPQWEAPSGAARVRVQGKRPRPDCTPPAGGCRRGLQERARVQESVSALVRVHVLLCVCACMHETHGRGAQRVQCVIPCTPFSQTQSKHMQVRLVLHHLLPPPTLW